jgi:hypothetical protein
MGNNALETKPVHQIFFGDILRVPSSNELATQAVRALNLNRVLRVKEMEIINPPESPHVAIMTFVFQPTPTKEQVAPRFIPQHTTEPVPYDHSRFIDPFLVWVDEGSLSKADRVGQRDLTRELSGKFSKIYFQILNRKPISSKMGLTDFLGQMNQSIQELFNPAKQALMLQLRLLHDKYPLMALQNTAYIGHGYGTWPATLAQTVLEQTAQERTDYNYVLPQEYTNLIENAARI